MEYITLNNNIKMPLLGYGVFQANDNETYMGVKMALEIGYRLIDTAAMYHNEVAVGRAIKDSGIPRDEIFVTTKAWISDTGYDNMQYAIARSLDRLQLDYIDLLLLHQPFGDIFGAWQAMVEAVNDGRIKSIGVSNFSNGQLQNLISWHKITPAVNQIETNPFIQRESESAYMRSVGVQHEGWAPFAEGKNGIFKNLVLREIAQAHGVTIGQVILRWQIQRGIVVIPKSIRRERIAENFDIFNFSLSSDDMQNIAMLNTGQSQFFSHDDPEQIARLMSWEVEE
ncbi:2,5-diketo-D-gluconic acid reductase [Lactococcus hodotermopsidis]|uniref:2,5-diketo-D-gluconic acid reductase n=1 Tax=Pseudolactococcus hodotermopsidis TaxID=2709157 RepID=A0A6A0BA50_9LACT|nr:aldo/keto reductase [Lactococcus hodotermopsidis]GFH42330.1 2,5-diketo-D-gluconic acid reductase [Lactococcus hodotermopsidis]